MSIGCKMRGLGESTYYTKSLKPQLDEIAGDNPYVIEHEVGKRRLRLKIDADANVIENITNKVNEKAPKSNSVSMEWFNGLPMTYNNVEYLACNSGQYIDTKIKATGTMRFELDAEATNWNYTNYLIGGINMKNNIIISMNYNNGYGTAGAIRYGSQSTFLSSNFHKLFTKYSYIFDCGKFYRNNTLVKTFEKEDFKSSCNTFLFAAYHDNYGLHNLGGKKVWYLNMYENGHNILKFVPALDPTGAPCMFDLVSRRPFYNKGSGDFTTNVNDTIFYPVEYIESTDRKPYIAINDLNCSTDIGIEITYRQDEINTDTVNPWIISGFGVASGTYPRPYLVVPAFRYSKLGEESSATTKVQGYYTTYQNANDTTGKAKYVVRDFVPGTYTASCNFYNDKKIIFDGTVLGDCDTLNSNISSIKNIVIFSFGNGESVYTPYNFKGKVYSVKITKGDTLVRDMVPALDYYGIPCLYDRITNKPYRNNGSGNFSYGPAISTYSLRNNNVQYTPEYAIKTPTGIRKLYHVPENYDGSIEDYANEHNYKRLVEPECPNEEGKHYASQWNETDTELILEWIEVEPPAIEEEIGEVSTEN